MRYAIILKGMPISEAEARLKSLGAQNIKPKPAMKQIFCDLDPEQATTLLNTAGIKVKEVKKVSGGQWITVPHTDIVSPQAVGLNLYDVYHELREAYTPLLHGAGLTVAVLDSGIRESHEALEGKVVHRANFSESTITGDLFGHGTGVAYIIAGEKGARSGVATGASLMNMKILNDNGEGTDEMTVDGIDAVCALVAAARAHDIPVTDPMYPNTINLSAGGEDDGDPDNAIRVAVRTAWEEYGIQVIAAVGNEGPGLSTVMCPACDPSVIAVGALKTWEFLISPISSRGPTKEGLIKPDLVCWGENIEVASHRADDEYESKSGTSFSTPILTAADGLIWDLTRRVYGENVRVTYHDWLQYAYAYCVKPDVAPLDKDNTYGYGMPAIGSMVQQVLRPVSPLSGVAESVAPVIGIGILGLVMTGIARIA
jgi:serine protease AprX